MGRVSSSKDEIRPVNLVVERLNQGLSVNRAAIAIGIARGSLQKAEAGEMPHPAVAKQIADFYGVKVTDVWPVDEAA